MEYKVIFIDKVIRLPSYSMISEDVNSTKLNYRTFTLQISLQHHLYYEGESFGHMKKVNENVQNSVEEIGENACFKANSHGLFSIYV